MTDSIHLPDGMVAYGGLRVDARPRPDADADARRPLGDEEGADEASPCSKTTEETS
ncbi:hypothetical protein AB0O39_01800 [Streptomyces anulatus]|uniref:hypothetical protein n=1 Tax=Streptomyces anulatus TaxID=1892 RepID=UPI003417BBA8